MSCTLADGVVKLTMPRANVRGDALRNLGWKPKYDHEHLFANLDAEVQTIKQHLEKA